MLISVVTLNFNGKKFLGPLFNSLKNQTHKDLEIIMVDNASTDGSTQYIKKNFPEVKIIQNKKNLGFAGGNNSALSVCKGDYIALINNDTILDKNCFKSLCEAVERDKNIGAVGPKILFYKPFINIKITIKFTSAIKPSAKISSDFGIKNLDYKKTIFQKNCWGEEIEDQNKKEISFHRVFNNAEIKIPIDHNQKISILEFKGSSPEMSHIKISIGDTIIFNESLNEKFQKYQIKLSKKLIQENSAHLINNAGSFFDKKNGESKDLGINQFDDGKFDKPKFVSALCGAGMLIKKELIDKIGLFDPYFFAYYEDTDFCWRAQKVGYKLKYQPSAVIRHHHAGTSREWSPFFIYHVERNRLALLIKNAKFSDAKREWLNFYKKTLRENLIDIKSVIFNRSQKNDIKIKHDQIRLKAALNLFANILPLTVKRYRIKKITKLP